MMSPQEKKCGRCGVYKPLSDFHATKSASSGYSYYCKPCNRDRTKEWRQKDNSKMNAATRKYKLKKMYGITEQEYLKLFQEQGGLCAICHKPETTVSYRNGEIQRLAVDHDHTTGKVRGLLCGNCNMGVGSFKDDPTALRNAALYLEKGA